MESPPSWLLEHLPLNVRLLPSSDGPSAKPKHVDARCHRPHITLTWAQSLDFKIAGPGGARVILSGPESMEMTHWAAILPSSSAPSVENPQPLILDPSLRFPLNARILSEWSKDKDKSQNRTCQPWLVCGQTVSLECRQEVERAGARVILTQLDETGRIPPNALPGLLSELGLRSVMIEGGSHILSAFLHAPPREDGSPLVDSVIVTVAPMFIGEGIGVVPNGHEVGLPALRTLHTETMGKDAVMVCAVEAPDTLSGK